MDLPPPTYALLVGLTLAAWPFVRGRAGDPGRRRLTGLVMLGLILLESGLALLYYSKAVCWTLAAAGAALIGFAAWPRRGIGLLAGLPALAFGVAFQLQPDPQGFQLYFGLGLPLAFVVALGAVAVRLLRDQRGAKPLLGAGLLLLGATAIPLSAFALGFLREFEVAHAPVLLLALAGLAILARQTQALPRVFAPDEYEGRAGGGDSRLSLLAPLAVGLAVLALAVIPSAPTGTSLTGSLLLAAIALAVAGSALGAAAGLARLANRREAAAFASGALGWVDGPQGSLPLRGAFVCEGLATIDDLDKTERLATAAHARLGILRVRLEGPLDELGHDVLSWLARPRPIPIHVAIVEGGETFYVPAIVPEEWA